MWADSESGATGVPRFARDGWPWSSTVLFRSCFWEQKDGRLGRFPQGNWAPQARSQIFDKFNY